MAGRRGPRRSASRGTPRVIVRAGGRGEPRGVLVGAARPGRGGGGAAARRRGLGGLVTVLRVSVRNRPPERGGEEPAEREPPSCTLTRGAPAGLVRCEPAAGGGISGAGVS